MGSTLTYSWPIVPQTRTGDGTEDFTFGYDLQGFAGQAGWSTIQMVGSVAEGHSSLEAFAILLALNGTVRLEGHIDVTYDEDTPNEVRIDLKVNLVFPLGGPVTVGSGSRFGVGFVGSWNNLSGPSWTGALNLGLHNMLPTTAMNLANQPTLTGSCNLVYVAPEV